MSIAAQTLTTLEFPKIRAQLARYTAFAASRELALALEPATLLEDVRRALDLTSEARALLDALPDTSVGGVRDVRPAVNHAARGGILDGVSLLEVAGTLAATRTLRHRLLRLEAECYPLLLELAHLLPLLPPIEEELLHAIGDDGQLHDHATPELARLRREIRVAFERLQAKLQHMIAAPSIGAALQEPIITVRNGRYVLPVKASHRKDVRGLVHDQSSSGATLYIEPIATLELNNRWRELQSAEGEEVQRILVAFSQQVGALAPQLVATVATVAELDFAFARAKYATALGAVAPTLSAWQPEQPLDDNADPGAAPLLLTAARHPLLDPATVVPTTIWLGGNFRLLLITGPNTGGKTVAIKTTGLLALMAQAGLHVPASAPARLPVFSHIFADIGDEQSIEQSLSTFSSHMRTIIRVLGALDEQPLPDEVWEADRWALLDHNRPRALVLFDELGAGTDPVEGAALARAIIERLLELGVLGVATTHYAELKAFAYNTPGVQNGSVEFDLETLAPTYRLSIGLPGRSNALAIASRLGLDPALVERARASLARDDVAVEDLLAGMHREREAAAAALARAEELREDAAKYRDRLEQEWRIFHEQREDAAQAARRELEDELRAVRSQLRRLREDLRSTNLSRQWLAEAEAHLNASAEQVRQTTARPQPSALPAPAQTPRPLQPGDSVIVRSVGLKGEIIAVDAEDGTAMVQVGGFRMNADLCELSREKQAPADQTKRYQAPTERNVSLPPTPEVAMSLDMRGWRVHEVNERLDNYLNDAYLAGLHQVRIIHGKGSGALRQVVRDTIQSHPLVKAFAGGGRDGGEGVTLVDLVER